MKQAGMLVSGADAIFDAIRSGKAKLVLTASDASAETKKHFIDKTAYYNVPCEEVALTKDELGEALGKKTAAAAAITSESFIKAYRASLARDKA